MITPDDYGIKDQKHYNYLKERSQKCAELFFKSKLIVPSFGIPDPRDEPLEESIRAEILKNYPKLSLKDYKKPNFLGVKDYFGIAIDFLYESHSASLDELCELYTVANTRALITQTIYLSYKTEFLLKKSLLQFITFFSSRYHLRLERKAIFEFENEEDMPKIFSLKIHTLKEGKYLILLSNDVSLALIKLSNSTAFIFDPSLAIARSLDPAKDLWRIAAKYGFQLNRFEIFLVSKILK